MKICNFKEDCSKVPIDDRCIEFCLEKVLRSAAVEEKQLILGLDATIANDIFYAYQGATINNFQDLRSYLTDEKADIIVAKFKSLNQYQLDYLNTDSSFREKVIQAVKVTMNVTKVEDWTDDFNDSTVPVE